MGGDDHGHGEEQRLRLRDEARPRGPDEVGRESRTLEALLDISPVAIVTLSPDATVTSWNRAAERLFGYPAEEAVGRPVDELVANRRELREAAERLNDEAWRSGRLQLVAERTRKDGTLVEVELSTGVLFDEAGRPASAIVVYYDRSALARAAEAQREAEERYRRLIEQLPLVTYIDQPDAVATGIYISPQVEALLGTPPEEWVGNSEMWSSLLHPDDRERAITAQDLVLATGQDRWSYEYRVIARDGRVVWLRDDGVVVRDPVGRALYVQGFLVDVTERKLVEEELRARETELRRERTYFASLLEISPVAVVTLDLEERVRSWNPAAERLFGYARDEAVGRSIYDLIPRTDGLRDEGLALTERPQAEGSTRLVTSRMRKDGVPVDVEMLMVPLVVDGETAGSYCIYYDVGELQRARREAEAANQAKSAFLATMSHEIRTPMNAIIGMTGLLLDTELSPEQHGFANVIRASGDSLLRLIDDILDFSKIESGSLELEIRPFDLRSCVEGALDMVAKAASEKGLDLAYVLEPSTPLAVAGDATRVGQVLVNLLGNAVKFTDAGEVVLTVDAERLAPRGDGPEALHRVRFSVRDTGVGIAPDEAERVFESFNQLDASTTRRHGGAGLGLAIARRLVALMDGEISVESEPGKGSIFRFTIVAEEAAATGVQTPEGAQAAIAGRRVLIVDDNAANREILERQTRSWGMVAFPTASPREALVWIRRGDPFDVAVLDLAMPELDGISLAREIRRHRDARALPLLLLTSLGRLDEDSRAAEFAACLTKPVKPSQLYETLTTALGEPPPPTGAAGPGPRAQTANDLRILLAEDNAVNRKIALLLLDKLGYRADVVENGLQVIAALEQERYDVVLMDVQMPELDGLAATRRIHERWAIGARPRIIAMTANAMQGDREECLSAGMDDYLAKPIRPEELADALTRAATAARRSQGAR